jgi:pimeloyl-ACP methyl ester carboxylesterase
VCKIHEDVSGDSSTSETPSETPLKRLHGAQILVPHVVVIGHSLGGAVATLIARDILYNRFKSCEAGKSIEKLVLCTFSAPRAFKQDELEEFMEYFKSGGKHRWYDIGAFGSGAPPLLDSFLDMVTTLPPGRCNLWSLLQKSSSFENTKQEWIDRGIFVINWATDNPSFTKSLKEHKSVSRFRLVKRAITNTLTTANYAIALHNIVQIDRKFEFCVASACPELNM